MREPFIFRKVVYLVEATPRRASGLDELLRCVACVDARSIGYHMHREFLAHRFVHAEYPNDFAHWVARVIGDEMLAERLANLNVFRFNSLEDLRGELAHQIAEHLTQNPAAVAERAPAGREFYFQAARTLVLDCRERAEDLRSLAASLQTVAASSIFYHLFATRFGGGDARNDFAVWIDQSLGEKELATRVGQIDPYMFSLDESRRRLIDLVAPAAARSAPTQSPETR